MIRDCAAFERVLAEALAGGDGAAPAVVAELRTHAEGCAACAPSLALVAMAAQKPSDRDPIPEPTDLDWARFDRRLKARLNAEASRGWTWTIAAIAATLFGALLGFWLLRPPEAPTIAQGPKPEPPRAETPKPEISGNVEENEFDSFARDPWSARGLADEEPDDPTDGPFPDVEQLDKEALERLERWLDEEEARLSPRGEA